ncbi:hypothetical protein GIB67_030744 [Kingdonia uniflora]|uniref:Uncharacterized protein n=1 Tax=Kingdonia uniflora TaxID=39325 RepID=A0A7J7L2W1_9MAGN|nr:hypothetical protein GIB67_030744 [Kingdonia uniflora]
MVSRCCYCNCNIGETKSLDHFLIQSEVTAEVGDFFANASGVRQRAFQLVKQLLQTRRHVLVRWTNPPLRYFKLNSDGSTLTSGMSGGGRIIRNHLGELQLGYSIALGHGTNTVAEMARWGHVSSKLQIKFKHSWREYNFSADATNIDATMAPLTNVWHTGRPIFLYEIEVRRKIDSVMEDKVLGLKKCFYETVMEEDNPRDRRILKKISVWKEL